MTIEKLAFLLSHESGDATLGHLSLKYKVSIQRITDALDVLKIMRGEPTQIPPVPWDGSSMIHRERSVLDATEVFQLSERKGNSGWHLDSCEHSASDPCTCDAPGWLFRRAQAISQIGE